VEIVVCFVLAMFHIAIFVIIVFFYVTAWRPWESLKNSSRNCKKSFFLIIIFIVGADSLQFHFCQATMH